ncbi:cytochrome subunit of sulfide dehydrogenase [Burkholderiaceae bacterium]|nr:cytochrome subunit of sulfide dehydrogenase [Burkholderiaceae bacterium]
MGQALRLAAALLVAAAPLVQAQDANLGRNLAATCANCHGTNGHARADSKPLAGVSAEKILAAIADFKSGAQPATIMHQIAKGYTDDQVKLIAAYFAAQPAAK